MSEPPTYYAYVDTPVGPFFLAGGETSLAMASFTTGWQTRQPRQGWVEDPAALRFASEQVEQYFAGERKHFDVPLEVGGTLFQKDVWRALWTIPFGETRSYGQVAKELGKPGASRAVGTANAANVLPLFIPCHRVVGTSGKLTGFGGGLETKSWLLEHEGARGQGRLFARGLLE